MSSGENVIITAGHLSAARFQTVAIQLTLGNRVFIAQMVKSHLSFVKISRRLQIRLTPSLPFLRDVRFC